MLNALALLRNIAAFVLAALSAVTPASAALAGCGGVLPGVGEHEDCCCEVALEPASHGCCSESEPPAPPERSSWDPGCGCRLAPSAPPVPARHESADASRDLRERLSVRTWVPTPAPSAASHLGLAQRALRPPPHDGAAPLPACSGGPARLHVLSIARL